MQLTEFKSPNPVGYYFGKRRLGVNMRDDYGRLIRAEKGAVGALEQGGDSFGGRSLAVVPTRTVALFSGIVKVGAGGVASIVLDVPDFNGSLRLMAVAWSANKLGHSDKMLIVRDPVVADILLPRFMAPGYATNAAHNLDNVVGARRQLRRHHPEPRPAFHQPSGAVSARTLRAGPAHPGAGNADRRRNRRGGGDAGCRRSRRLSCQP